VRKVFLIILILLSSLKIGAQYDYLRKVELVEDLLGEIATDEEDLDYTTLFNDLLYYMENPLQLNSASYEEFEKLYLLTHSQINRLLEYIQSNGNLLSLNELSLVDGFTPRLAELVSPLITLDPAPTGVREMPPGQARPKNSHQLLMRSSAVLQQRKGYSEIDDSLLAASPNSRYLGSPVKLYTRYSFTSGKKIIAGFTAEKDAGEEFFRGSNKHGFDFNSAHLQVNDVGKIKRLVIGDYQVGMGQGLNIWSGLSFGKSPDVLNVRKKNQDIRRYTSVDENRFMRGISSTVELGSFELTTFLSYKRIDANIIAPDSIDDELTEFSSFQTTGLHALPREIEDENSIRETLAGGHLSRKLSNGRIGFSFVNYHFDGEWNYQGSRQSSSHFSGSNGFNTGLDYQFGWKKIIIFGEAGMNDSQSMALLNGASMSLSPELSLSVVHRFFQPDYYALYGNAFKESTTNSNEHGLYIGAVLDPFPKWTFTGSLDSYSFPWLTRYVTAVSGSGYDLMLQGEYQITDDFSAYLRYKKETKPEDSRLESPGINDVVREYMDRLRMHFSYSLTEEIIFQDRLELALYEKEDVRQSGYLLYHDILYRPQNARMSFTFRYCMFDTEGYDSRIYLYEHDVLYAFRVPSFHDRGIRTYLNAKYSLSEHIDLWLKLSDTYYPDREVIGSGLNEIVGKHKTGINFQLRLRI